MVSDTSDRETLSHRLDQLPEHVRYHARRGFASLAEVGDAKLDQFLTDYFAAAEGGGPLETDAFVRILDLDERAASDALVATSLTLGAITDLSVTAEDFLNAGREKIFEVESQDVASILANRVVAQRGALRDAMERSSITNAILPTLQNSAVELDLRLRFDDEDKVTDGALVVIVGIRTDIEDDFYFQLSPDDLRRLIRRLEEAERRLTSSGDLLGRLAQ